MWTDSYSLLCVFFQPLFDTWVPGVVSCGLSGTWKLFIFYLIWLLAPAARLSLSGTVVFLTSVRMNLLGSLLVYSELAFTKWIWLQLYVFILRWQTVLNLQSSNIAEQALNNYLDFLRKWVSFQTNALGKTQSKPD